MTNHESLYKRAEEAQRLADDESVLLAAVMAFTQAGRNKRADLQGAMKEAIIAASHDHLKLIRDLAAEVVRLEKGAALVRAEALRHAMEECRKTVYRGLGHVGARNCSEIEAALDAMHIAAVQAAARTGDSHER